MTGNELVAEVKDSETVWTGTRLIEDGFDLKEAFESKSWVAGGLATLATAADTASAVMDPLGEAMSAGVAWVIEHLGSLNEWLNELTGDSDAVAAAASTWSNIGTKLGSCADDLETVCTGRLAGQESLAVATFKSLQAGSASHLRMTGGVASAISGGLTVASVIVRMVHDLVRDAIADVIGKVASKVAIGVLTAGLAAPWAVASVIADVSSWVTRLSKEVADVVLSARNLKGLLDKASKLLDDVGAAFGRITSSIGEAAAKAGDGVAGAARQVGDFLSSLRPQQALAGAPGMTTRQAREVTKASPTVYRPKGPKTTKPSRSNPNEGRWGVTLNETSTGAKGADDAADAAKSSTKQSDDAAKADAPERAEADSSAATGDGATQWDDPGKVQEWYDDLPTKTHAPSTEAYQYQHRVLGTDVERQLTTDSGETIWADSVTADGAGIAKAWDAKHTGGGDDALYQGKGPEFLMNKFDDEMRRYGKVIRSSGNPVSSLTLVTNTPESVEFLGQRARDILGPDVELHIQLVP